VVGNGRIYLGGRAGLILDNSGVVREDRIPDDVPVHLNGLKLTLIGRPDAQLTENLGTVHTERGLRNYPEMLSLFFPMRIELYAASE